jgi:predicted lipoprotein with Yx(FWY)xxD motif
MKTVLSAFALLLASSALSFAAEPAMVAEGAGGKMYTDAKGMTLYTYDKDSGGKSACNGDCAVNWPPLMAAADAKDEGEWTVVTRDDGAKMWAYEGKPLYTFIQDKKAGDVTGDGKGGVWHIAKAD